MKKSLSVSLLVIIVYSLISCNPRISDFDTGALPYFSTDTISFDTVFTTIGSATHSFKVYNHSTKPMLISEISLAGGETSFFRLNIDGFSTVSENNVEIPPKDSLFIFVEVTVDPTNTNNPVLIKDSIVFDANGTLKDVKLIAFGQDVHLINGEIITTQTWVNDKPYLVYNSMAVDTGQTLTIEEGVCIYFHHQSSMIVWGTIIVNGTWGLPVIFQNDRLEPFYQTIAGQWGTLYIDPISTGNIINHAVIRNSIAGIQIGYPSNYNIPDLELSNSFIMNTSYAGIYAFGADITCYNTVISNSAGAATALLRGGNYRFMHCSISNNGVYGTNRSGPSVVITNTFTNLEYNDITGQYDYIQRDGDLTLADFNNSIIYGNLIHELQFSDNGLSMFNYQFNHCLIKAHEDSVDRNDTDHYLAIILNEDPSFINDSDRYHLNYRLDTLSPAKDTGDMAIIVTYPQLSNDISGNSRTMDGKPDLGAFERKED